VNDAGVTADDESDVAAERDRYALMLRDLPGFVYQTTAGPGVPEHYTYLSSDVYVTGHDVRHWLDDADAWVSLVHPDDVEAVLAANATALETGRPYQMVYREQRIDGSWMWVLDTAQVHVDSTAFRTWTGFCQDVTERFRLERAREVHVRRLLLLLERIHAVVFEIDDRGLAYVSPGAICGRQGGEFLASPSLWREVVHLDDVRRVAQQLSAALRERCEVAFQFRMIQPDGAVATATTHLVPYLEADGSTTMIGFVLDMSELKRAEDTAELALHQLKLAVDHAGVVPYEYSRGRALVPSGEAPARLIAHPRDAAAFEAAHAEAQLTGAPISLEFRYRLEGEEEWRWGLARASRVPDAGHPGTGPVSGVLIDTTREHELSERWRRIDRALTPRERETFRLLGRGATNNDIAASLGISHSTATHHVARVLSKLDLPNRSAGAALASELRLSMPLVDSDADREK
jgi:DNA-binding CsgD family transcriptional regulator